MLQCRNVVFVVEEYFFEIDCYCQILSVLVCHHRIVIVVVYDVCVVEEYVESTVFLFGGSNHYFVVDSFGDVCMDVSCGLFGTADFFDSGLFGLVVEVYSYYFGVFLGKQKGGFAVNVVGCICDQGNFVFQFYESYLLFVNYESELSIIVYRLLFLFVVDGWDQTILGFVLK